VQMEKEPKTFKGSQLAKPDTVHETAVGWGEVVALGHGHYTGKGIVPMTELKVGDRVAFIKFLKEAQTNKAIQHTIGEGRLMLKIEDVLVVQSGEPA